MSLSRRNLLLSTLFGTSMVGLRALATGLPAALLLDPRKALADGTCLSAQKAQFIIMSTSSGGDPINGNVPGTYEDPNIVHPTDPTMAPTPITIKGQPHTAAKPWSTLPQDALDRTVFFHMMTSTPIHPMEPNVLKLMGASQGNEMLPSLLAKQLAPCLGTIQTQPISLGASTPAEALSYGGAPQPVIPPLALKTTLTSPAGPLANMQQLRDQGLNQLYDVYKDGASPAQKAYIDSMVTSQAQLRNINQSLLGSLSSLADNGPDSQAQAAVTLIQMKVTPLISIHIPFGGDNHFDAGLVKETAQTVTGVASIVKLLAALKAANLQDMVTFMSLNVFGRTMSKNNPINAGGRTHNQNHQVSIVIGAPFKGGVIGGVAPVGNDYGATAIDSQSGASSASGDIAASTTLASFAKTMLAGVGGDPSPVITGQVVQGALA